MSRHRSCAFCGCADCKISREHAWPKWSRKLVAPAGISTVRGVRHLSAHPVTVTFQSIDDMGLTVGDVCKRRCNEGWMSALENRVEPLLTPLIRDGSRVVLDMGAQAVLARWALKTAMVFEFTSKTDKFYRFEERNALLEGRVASSIVYTQMWLAQYLGPHMSLGFGTKILFDMEVANQLVPMHAHSASIALGQFLFQTLTVRVPAGFDGTLQFPYHQRWHSRLGVFWPPQDSVIWPPRDAIANEGEFNDLIKRFEQGPVFLSVPRAD